MEKKVDVCLSPDLIHLYDLSDKSVVVVDILRATSCMTSGFAHGVQKIKPLEDLESCRALQSEGYIIAGERNGIKVDGFDLGNSPFDYQKDFTKGKNIAVTTTNGTVAIERSKKAKEVLIGSFLNKTALADYLKKSEIDVLIHCAGWKGKFNLEDTLFAGAMVAALAPEYQPACDSPLAAKILYETAKSDLFGFLQHSSHFQRLSKLGITEDIRFCLQEDRYDVVPILEGDEIINLQA